MIQQNQPFVLKAVEFLLNDKLKLANIGSPIKLIRHEVMEKNKFLDVKSSLRLIFVSF
jgi:hypothetical protein